MHQTKPITWQQLIELEPRLRDLLDTAKAIRDDSEEPHFCANKLWYGSRENGHREPGLKDELLELVGMCSANKDHPVLGSSRAYDVAYLTIYDVLPECRGCSCL